jgi:hypothetical protein
MRFELDGNSTRFELRKQGVNIADMERRDPTSDAVS